MALTPAERCRRWRDAHPERQKAANAKWHAENGAALNARKRAFAATPEGKAQVSERNRKYYDANKASEIARNKAYIAANRERTRERFKLAAQKAERKEAAARSQKRWREANRDHVRIKAREIDRRRVARMRGTAIGRISYAAILKQANGTCGICRMPISDGLFEFDHIIPIALGGGHVQENIQLAHRRCNRSKGARVAA